MKQTDCSSSDSCSAESVITDASRAACDAENLPYDPQLSSFPAVKENVSVRETRKPRNRTNASHILKDQGSSGSADSDPSVPCRDQEEIPTFEEWTKIMMEVENEKSQITHVSNGLHAAGKKLQQTFTNYASVECGAKILSSNPEAKSTSAILMENMDMYMLNPCNNKIWLVDCGLQISWISLGSQKAPALLKTHAPRRSQTPLKHGSKLEDAPVQTTLTERDRHSAARRRGRSGWVFWEKPV
ncbi:hypothetical protein QQF64_014261 [Cirrhinus molitorella]|uniref:Uncharacterized protein n=1 Tax=Cirrhinus molitorella TaxID=172907 RepID=A0ABR3NSA4_9TELE